MLFGLFVGWASGLATMGLEHVLCGVLRGCWTHVGLSTVHKTLRGRAAVFSLPLQSSGSFIRSRASALLNGVFLHQLPGRRSLCTAAQTSKDVTLFLHDRTRFFRLLSIFCGGQVFFWTYLAHFAYTELRNTGGSADTRNAKATPTVTGLAGMWSFEMNLGSNTWRYGFTLGCLAIAAGIVGLGTLFSLRSVSKVILHKGGKMVTVCTQSPLGLDRGHKITVPLSQVACYAHRRESPSFVPLRVKGHKFYFLLDKDGTVTNARLFDTTVGAYRHI